MLPAQERTPAEELSLLGYTKIVRIHEHSYSNTIQSTTERSLTTVCYRELLHSDHTVCLLVPPFKRQCRTGLRSTKTIEVRVSLRDLRTISPQQGLRLSTDIQLTWIFQFHSSPLLHQDVGHNALTLASCNRSSVRSTDWTRCAQSSRDRKSNTPAVWCT